MNRIKKQIRKLIQTEAPEWFDEQLVRLGGYDHVVLTPVAGRLYARQYNGKVIVVHNGTAHVPAIFDLHVRVGRKKSLPNIWQIIAIQEDYDTPAAGGQLAYHHTQHEFPAVDTVWVSRKQIVPLTVLVSDPSNFIVQVYGSVAHTNSGLAQIDTQTVNLSSYVVTAGAKFVSIETDDDGVLTVHEGVAFSAPTLGTVDDVPVPDPGKYLLAYILLYEGQTALSNDDVQVPMPLGLVAKGSGLQIHDATADTPLDADEFGFWDVVDSLIKKITWANIKDTLKIYFDTLYATLAHTHTIFNDSEGDPADVTTGSAVDGTSVYAARRDHVHHFTMPDVEVVMEDGVTFPPVPITTEAGDDWIYSN